MDLIRGLPAEDTGEEISESAGEQFRAKVSAAMFSLVTLSVPKNNTGDGLERRSELESRTLADWCSRFAKPRTWGAVRGYQIWCRRDKGQMLRIALRVGLFNQRGVGGSDLGRFSQKQFNELAKRYGVGTDCKVNGGDQRAVELEQEFLVDIFAEPAIETDEANGRPPGSSAPFSEKHQSVELNGQTDDTCSLPACREHAVRPFVRRVMVGI